jgi:hypothetical protein
LKHRQKLNCKAQQVYLKQVNDAMGKRSQQLYVIRNMENGRIKIGISEDIKTRFSGLMCASGCELKLLFTSIPYSNARFLEYAIHSKINKHRHIGEWFNIDEKYALSVVSEFVNKDEQYYQEVINALYEEELLEKRKYKTGLRISKMQSYSSDSINLNKYQRIGQNVFADKKRKRFFHIEFKDKRWRVEELTRIDED